MKYYSTLIFDFDGTIADSFYLTYTIYNSLAQKHNLKKISKRDITVLRTMKPFELLKFINIPFYRIPFLLFEARKMFKESIEKVTPVEGIHEVLDSLQKDYTLGILTSNTRENVERFFDKYDFNMFSFIYSEGNLFGKDKALSRIIKDRSLNREKTLYIADEVRDIESCKKINLPICAVTWGFNEAGVLAKQNPNYVVNYPKELLQVLYTK